MRKNSDFIQAFQQVALGGTSPKIFHQWAALTCIAGALERRCWTQTRQNPLTGRTYPTMCTFLVAGGGVGKADPVRLCSNLWRSVPELRNAPESLTAAAFYDSASSDYRTLKDGTIYQPLLISTEEVSCFFTQYEHELVGAWVKCYDCAEQVDQLRRHMKGQTLVIEKPSLSFLMAGQPELMQVFFPDLAYAQGFMGRALLVCSESKERTQGVSGAEGILKDLQHDIKEITNLEGPFKRPESFIELMRKEEDANQEIVRNPPHPRLQTYFQRKHQHAVKIAMALSVARGDSLILTDDLFFEALDILAKTEKNMTLAFRVAAVSEDSILIDSVIEELGVLGKGGVSFSDLWRILSRKAPSVKIESLIKTMVNSNLIKPKGGNNTQINTSTRFMIQSQVKESEKIQKIN